MKGYSVKVITCRRCDKDFERRHSAQRFCPACREIGAQETCRRRDRAYKSRVKDDPAYRSRRTEQTRDYVRRNKEKADEYQRAYALRKADYKRERARERRQENPEKFAEMSRIRHERAKAAGYPYHKTAKAKASRRARENRRRTESPAFVIDGRMSVNMRLAIKAGKAGRKWETVVGYTLPQLMAHLEKQFLKGMSWQNVGEWHIDHILPRASFNYQSDTDAEFRACWALTNLQPLWAADNIKKRDKVLVLI